MSYDKTFDQWPKEFHDGPFEGMPLQNPRESLMTVEAKGNTLKFFREGMEIYCAAFGPETMEMVIFEFSAELNRRNRILRNQKERAAYERECRIEALSK